jgi:Leucine-rich repeat (LRR) protein
MIRSFAKDVSDHENFCNESMSTTNLFEARRLSIVKNNEPDKHNDDSNENVDNGEIIGGEENINENMENNGHINNNEARKDAKSVKSASLHGLKRMKYLRTLVLHKSTVPDGIRVDTFKELNLLRVLDLREVRGIEVLPIAVGSLEHLRYLNISQTKIKRVPRSIVDLKMLQYLLLRNCSQIETLPKGIGKLRHLRCLDISGTGIRVINWSFSGMEQLISMQGFRYWYQGYKLELFWHGTAYLYARLPYGKEWFATVTGS